MTAATHRFADGPATELEVLIAAPAVIAALAENPGAGPGVGR